MYVSLFSGFGYAIKDIFFILTFPFFLLFSYNKKFWVYIIFLVILSVYAALNSLSDPILYFISLREFLFYPVFFAMLGYVFSRRYFSSYLLIVSSFYVFYTFIFFIFFPDYSFGPTGRLKAFWDREHEPAIVGGVAFLSAWFFLSGKKRLLLLVLSLLLISFSGSRSGIAGVFLALFCVYFRTASIKKILFFIALSFILFAFFLKFNVSGRAIDHNLIDRVNQYSMAWNALLYSNFLGIGTDKYGVVSGIVSKEFCLDGACTTTMDSSLIKYSVNYGLLFVFVFVFFVFFLVGRYLKNGRRNAYFISICIFSFFIGLVTGKLGAFPMNMFFYGAVGSILAIGEKE